MMLATRRSLLFAVPRFSRSCATAGVQFDDGASKPEVERLLDAMLPHVQKHGWTDATIAAAIHDLNWSPAAAGLLPRGAASAVHLLVMRFNEELPKALVAADALSAVKAKQSDSQELRSGIASEQGSKMSDTANANDLEGEAHARAFRAIQTRIQMASPYRASWSQALQLQAQPRNVKYAAIASAKLADEVAHYAGYRAPDFSWYTDRSVLAGAFHATEIFWLADRSKEQRDTWRFLSRGLREAQKLRDGAGSAAGTAATVADAAFSTLSTIFRAGRKSY